MSSIPRLMIAGTGSGSGKTTLTCALLKHFHKNGHKVVAFKCGPDYIDPMFHTEVLQTKSYNLDLFMLGENTCKQLIYKHGKDADLSLIEGVMGFYDGISDTDKASSYDLAYRTQTPVVLVVSCKGMGLSLAALIQGYLNFKPNTLRGIILNGVTHMSYSFYKKVVEAHTPLKVFGYLPFIPECSLESRHLGLVTAKEVECLQEKMEKLAEKAANTIDFEGLMVLAQSSSPLEHSPTEPLPSIKSEKVKIGIAQDKAFSFYYADNLELFEALGAELVFFSPIKDEKLPEGIQGIVLGGGYPEIYAKALSENNAMRACIKKELERGMPCIAECGGFMYLQHSLRLLDGTVYPMVGHLEGEAFMTDKLSRFGYTQLTCEQDNMLMSKGSILRAHEFHYSDSTYNGSSFTANKPLSDKTWSCIIANDHLFAGYPHVHLWSDIAMAKKFIQKCEVYKK